MMVIGDRVNLRNQDSLDSDIIGQVNYGDELELLGMEGEWAMVRPPASLGVWVHGGLLFEEREVRARVLNVRNGPGTQFHSLGLLQRGTPVQVTGAHEEWRRIAVPASIHVWIHRDLLQVVVPLPEPEGGGETAAADAVGAMEDPAVPEEAEAAAVEAPEGGLQEEVEQILTELDVDSMPEVEAEVEVEAAQAGVSEVDMQPGAEVETPSRGELVPLAGQGTPAIRRGWVKAYLLAGSSPSRFHLVHREGGTERTLSYLYGDEQELRALSGRQVMVRGRDFWVTGQRLPLMRIEQIQVLETP